MCITPEDRRQYLETLEGMGYSGKHMLQDYFQDLADDSGIELSVVRSLATVLGPSEFFDGLVTACEDYAEDGFVNFD